MQTNEKLEYLLLTEPIKEPFRDGGYGNVYVNLERRVNNALNAGWTKVSPLIQVRNDMLVVEFMRTKPEQQNDSAVPLEVKAAVLDECIARLDIRMRDLLFLNDIEIAPTNGYDLVIIYDGGQKSTYFAPLTVVNLLKKSTHVPLSTDFDNVLEEMKKLSDNYDKELQKCGS